MRLTRIVFCLLVSLGIFTATVSSAQQPDQPSKSTKTKSAKALKVDPGIKKYGNVTFADPTNHKYPIDNAAHTRGSWRAINVKNNASKYKSEELAQIKQRIHDAGTKQGIKFQDEKTNTPKTKVKTKSKPPSK